MIVWYDPLFRIPPRGTVSKESRPPSRRQGGAPGLHVPCALPERLQHCARGLRPTRISATRIMRGLFAGARGSRHLFQRQRLQNSQRARPAKRRILCWKLGVGTAWTPSRSTVGSLQGGLRERRGSRVRLRSGGGTCLTLITCLTHDFFKSGE